METSFVCSECGCEYPLIAKTSKGTCRACVSAKRREAGLKGLFMRREKHNRFTFNSMNSHREKAKRLTEQKVLDSQPK